MTNDQQSVPLRRKEVSKYLQSKYNISRTPGTLAKLAVTGGGPPFQYVGRVPMYPISELDRWAENQFSQLVSSTAQAKEGNSAEPYYG